MLATVVALRVITAQVNSAGVAATNRLPQVALKEGNTGCRGGALQKGLRRRDSLHSVCMVFEGGHDVRRHVERVMGQPTANVQRVSAAARGVRGHGQRRTPKSVEN